MIRIGSWTLLTHGDYAFNMTALVHDRLPQFTEEQSEMIKGSSDFLGVDCYTSYYAKCVSWPSNVNISYENKEQFFAQGNFIFHLLPFRNRIDNISTRCCKAHTPNSHNFSGLLQHGAIFNKPAIYRMKFEISSQNINFQYCQCWGFLLSLI